MIFNSRRSARLRAVDPRECQCCSQWQLQVSPACHAVERTAAERLTVSADSSRRSRVSPLDVERAAAADSDGAVRRVTTALARLRSRLFVESRCSRAQRSVALLPYCSCLCVACSPLLSARWLPGRPSATHKSSGTAPACGYRMAESQWQTAPAMRSAYFRAMGSSCAPWGGPETARVSFDGSPDYCGGETRWPGSTGTRAPTSSRRPADWPVACDPRAVRGVETRNASVWA